VSAVQAAKTAAGAKGAREVGALKSDDFAGLGSGSYVIYSGVYHARAQATKALARLKKTFPGASVIKVSGESSRSSGTSSSGVAAGGSGAGAGSAHPAPPSAGHHKSGQSYEQESRNLPDVISTG
jgi:hypothetical protein